ncbi:MAG: acyltransferase [Clostridiales bacterium]|nr:acyltransferase [Clostridiales bacterium]MDO4350232.1 acyltransferase [Eubacteriales bacterium]MDY4009798.1 acyltransferase [Candidatus Limiplasma sp.]
MRPSKRERRLEIGVLYGFRALMVLLVANYHIWQQSWLPQRFTLFGQSYSFDFLTRSSYLFVDGMMLLSGFLLYLPYARQTVEGTPAPGPGRFYWKRALRIIPSYLAAVLLALCLFALPQGAYPSRGALVWDVLAHLTFTFPFWPQTYLYTPLNGALWTIAVEMQFYLLFPLLARAAQKRPALTLSLMAAAGWAYRFCVYRFAADTSLLINQLPSFLDVYALGMLGALGYCRAQAPAAGLGPRARRALQWACAAAFAVGCVCVCQLLGAQSAASAQGHAALRLSQLIIRFPLAAALLLMMLAASQMPRALQKLLDNRLMRFLSVISMNLYIWHQILAVQMRQAWFPDANALHASAPQQRAYTVLCFSVSILVAMIATYGLEEPVARAANRMIKHFGRQKNHEGSQTGQIEQAADTVLVRAESGRAGVD